MKLSENIRAFRRARGLTQEQLAEVLDVTVGAVYKWESGQSTPELATILELADFFDTSVDALLGYEMKDNRLQATVERLRRCRDEKDRAGFAEAEKALKKYPNSFDVVYGSALLYTCSARRRRKSRFCTARWSCWRAAACCLRRTLIRRSARPRSMGKRRRSCWRWAMRSGPFRCCKSTTRAGCMTTLSA